MPRKLIRTLAVLGTLALFAAGCSKEGRPTADPSAAPSSSEPDATRRPNTNPPVVATAASLERFDACPELLGYLREEGAKRVGPWGLGGLSHGAMPLLAQTDAAAEGSSAAASAPARDAAGADGSFSSTNVQEAGVDEPDIVKTNGKHIFTTRWSEADRRQRVVATATNGGVPRIVGGVNLPEGAGGELLLSGDRLLAIGYGSGMPVAYDIYQPGPERTIVAIVDVSDPTRMRVTDVVRLEGSYASARMVGGIVRMVLNTSSPERLEFEQPGSEAASAQRAALDANRKIARTASLDALLPRYKLLGPDGEKRSEGPLATCSSTYHPKRFSGFRTTSVITIDPADPDPRNSAAVMGGAGIVYASTDNLYVATQEWPEFQPLVIEDGTVPAPPVVDPSKTNLHRFDISDERNAVYAASGEVRGTVLNQWSMSEHGGHLRVATTHDRNATAPAPGGAEGSSSTENFVTTFTASGGELKQTGQVRGLGRPNERIFGVRFIGNLGYVVTFEQKDPLYVIDLSDATAPKVLGELEIPGYSAYLHPVGEGRLLGVGQDADPKDGRTLGTQISLFDVRDPKAPKRIDRIVFKDGNSPVEWDHHAFTWWAEKDLAVVPITKYGSFDEPVQSDRPQVPEIQAAIGFRVAGDDLREVGRASQVKHADDPGMAQISRSIVIGDRLFTISEVGVMSSDLDGFAERGWAAYR